MGIEILATTGAGGSAVPYDRSASMMQAGMSHSPADTLRLRRYEEHWRFFTGIQWNFNREDGEPLVTANYCRTIVNKKASWLVGKGMAIGVPQALHEVTKPVLDEVWKSNDQDVLLMEMAVSGGITGDVYVMPTIQYADSHQQRIDPYTKGQIRLRFIPSHQVFPVWNPRNKEQLEYVRIVTEVNVPQAWQTAADARALPTMNTGIVHKRKYVELITRETVEEGWEGTPMVSRPNNLGEIPLVHIPNETVPGEYYGMSDLEGVIDMQRELNEKLTDVSDIINYHAAPVTIIIGAKAKNLEKGAKNLWSGLPTGAQVSNLNMGTELAASTSYITHIQQIIMDISGIPEGSLGRIQAISNTSAAALEVQFQPLVEATDRKRPNYVKGVQKLNYYILRLHQLLNNAVFPVDMCRHCGGRIVEFQQPGRDGVMRWKKKCYLVDPQTLDFLHPDDVMVKVKRVLSFGTETREMRYAEVKKQFKKKSYSYWDPENAIDLEKEAIAKKEHAEKQAAEAQGQNSQALDDQHERELQLQAAKQRPQLPAKKE